MIIQTEIILKSTVLHKVGNKLHNEGLQLSKSELEIPEALGDLLLRYFLSPFKSEEYFNLFHESDIKLNPVFNCVSDIFENPDLSTFYNQTVNLAKHLYESSNHPQIKSGEFYVAYLQNCIVDGEQVDGIGLFKSESKDTFLKIYPKQDNYQIDYEDGININKLDKGCLIFNTEKENGFLVTVVDTSGKGSSAQYWKDDFLKLRHRNDNYFQTGSMMEMVKEFVTEELPKEYDVPKPDQIDLLNKSVDYLKKNSEFSMGEFTDEVIGQEEVIKKFKDYKKHYEEGWDVDIPESFEVSSNAVKKKARVMKSVIKLDKNFHIYVHGKRELIQKGFDEESGMHFYQLFFEQEN